MVTQRASKVNGRNGKNGTHDVDPEPYRRELHADMTAEAAFAALAGPLTAEATAYAAAIANDPSAEALHKLRVAVRRLRSLLWAYAPRLDKDEVARQRTLYKFLANAAGQTRDWDIAIELVGEHAEDETTLLEQCRHARDEAMAHSRATLEQADAKHALRELLTASNRELNTASDRVGVRRFATQRVHTARKSLKKRMRRAAHAKRADYAAYHEVRKAGKKLRYLLEGFAPVLEGKQRKTLKLLKRIQKRFGNLNDVVASESLLAQASAHEGSHSGGIDAAHARPAIKRLHQERKRRMRLAEKLL